MVRFLSFLFLLLSVLTFASPRPPKKLFFALGGGDSPEAWDIFSENFKDFAAKAKEAGYESDYLFGGNHPGTDRKVAEAFGQTDSRDHAFTHENFKRFKDAIQNKLASGEIQPGDQVMFYVSTHGTPFGTLSTSEKTSVLPTSEIRDLINLLAASGARVGFYNGACYQGGLPFDQIRDEVCDISSASKDASANTSAEKKFIDQLSPGKNLEDTFLESRQPALTPFGSIFSSPQISSPSGRLTGELLRTSLKGVDYTHYELQLSQFEEATCMNQCVEINTTHPLGGSGRDLSNAIQSILKFELQKDPELKSGIERYEKAIFDYREEFKSQAMEFIRLRDRFSSLDRKAGALYQVLLDLHMRCDQRGYAASELAESSVPAPRCTDQKDAVALLDYEQKRGELRKIWSELESLIGSRDKARQKLEELGPQNPNSVLGTLRFASHALNPLTRKAYTALEAEKALYLRLYSLASKDTQDQPNPCRDFRF